MSQQGDDFGARDGLRLPREPDEREVRAEARARTVKTTAITLASMALVLLLGVSTYTVVQIREVQKQNKPTLDTTRSVAEQIRDCTDPSGVCFKRGQAQTASAVGGINTVTVRTNACVVTLLKSLPPETRLTTRQYAIKIKKCVQGQSIVVPVVEPVEKPAAAPPALRRSGTAPSLTDLLRKAPDAPGKSDGKGKKKGKGKARKSR